MTSLAIWLTAVGTNLASVAAVGVAAWGNGRDNERRRLEEAAGRRNDSVLGAVIIESLLEEVRSGHAIMVRLLQGINADSEALTQWSHTISRAMNSPGVAKAMWGQASAERPLEGSVHAVTTSGAVFAPTREENERNGASGRETLQLLPGASWENPETIPSSVLLRIIATDSGCAANEFSVRNVRVHCKNYFVHMRENVDAHILKIQGDDWPLWEEAALRKLLANGPGDEDYIGDTEKVIAMLGTAHDRLEKNATQRFPK